LAVYAIAFVSESFIFHALTLFFKENKILILLQVLINYFSNFLLKFKELKYFS